MWEEKTDKIIGWNNNKKNFVRSRTYSGIAVNSIPTKLGMNCLLTDFHTVWNKMGGFLKHNLKVAIKVIK